MSVNRTRIAIVMICIRRSSSRVESDCSLSVNRVPRLSSECLASEKRDRLVSNLHNYEPKVLMCLRSYPELKSTLDVNLFAVALEASITFTIRKRPLTCYDCFNERHHATTASACKGSTVLTCPVILFETLIGTAITILISNMANVPLKYVVRCS